jgi:flavodoxin
MKTLIVYTSYHHGNTKKVVDAIAEVLKADVKDAKDCKPETLDGYDMVGLGSGIYGWKHDKIQFELVERVDGMGKKAFVFCTSGGGKDKSNRHMARALEKQGFEVLGSFACRGFCTWGPFKLLGGSGKGRPNDEDLKAAREFAKRIRD